MMTGDINVANDGVECKSRDDNDPHSNRTATTSAPYLSVPTAITKPAMVCERKRSAATLHAPRRRNASDNNTAQSNPAAKTAAHPARRCLSPQTI